MTYRDIFIEAFDVLSPRGNQAFGQPGEHAAAQLLPWPSVLAGALRSAALASAGHSSGASIEALVKKNAELACQLALPGAAAHGSAFQLGSFGLARNDGASTQPVMQLPVDLVVTGEPGRYALERLVPASLPTAIQTSSAGLAVPLLRTAGSAKPVTGLWLNSDGWQAYCSGRVPQSDQLLDVSEIASRRQSVGIGMDAGLRRVEKGQLYTAERIELRDGVGYWARIHNPQACQIDSSLLRLGGDGHAAHLSNINVALPQVPVAQIKKQGRFALVLTSPALFENGSTPAIIGSEGLWQEKDFSARLVCHLAGRPEIISGWDLQRGRPKPARRFVPAGSVYWFDNFNGNPQALLDCFSKGNWYEPLAETEHRLTEGFNQVQLVAWNGDASDGI